MITINAGFTHSDSITCPQCGGAYLHHGEVVVYDRAGEDATTGSITSNETGQKKDAYMGRNQSPRRGGLTIKFDCEECDAEPILAIVQHKGSTYVYWHSARMLYGAGRNKT